MDGFIKNNEIPDGFYILSNDMMKSIEKLQEQLERENLKRRVIIEKYLSMDKQIMKIEEKFGVKPYATIISTQENNNGATKS